MNTPYFKAKPKANSGSVQRVVRRRWVLYCLVEKGSRVRYFGITTQKPGRRLLQHYADASRKRNDHKTNWIRRCVDEGIPIDIRILKSNLVEAKAFYYEKRLIRFFGKAFALVNTHEGGSSGYQGLSAEAKSRHLESTRKALAGRDWKSHFANMRAAKERKRLANPVEREPKFIRWFPLELGLRDKRTGDVAWCDFRSVRDAAKRLSVVQTFYQ